MSGRAVPAPVELVPAQRQVLWGWPAVANFVLGGLGAGYYAVATAAAGLGRPPAVVLADWLGPALVLAVFAAVAGEAGRPLRGPRVLLRVRTSWMSRELWLGGAFALLALADLAFPLALHRVQAAVLALGLAAAQGFILRRARGVAAWSAPVMPWVFLASALLSVAGLWLIVTAAQGERPGRGVAVALLGLLAAGLAVWMRYLGWAADPAFAAAVRGLAEGRGSRTLVTAGYVVPLGLLAAAAALPGPGAPLALAAGALMLGAQVYAKAVLILEAGRLRPVTLAGIVVTRRLS